MEKDNLTAKAVKLVDLVNYETGSVVSRALIDRPSGTVTLFAFDQGQGLSEHTAPYDALVYVLDGETEITIAGKPVHAAAGDMVIMPANQPHALKATKKFRMMLVMVRS